MAERVKVFGVGLNKTGTSSLRQAMKRLGYRHLDRSPALFKAWRRKDWGEIFAAADAHESFDDWPWPLMVEELWARYGERARFVLTRRRSAEVWVESLKRHAMRTGPGKSPRAAIYGHEYPHGAEAEHIAFYEEHLAGVRAFFADKPGGLLEVAWDEGDGWEALCGFLGHPAPRRPFPHANRSGEAAVTSPRFAQNARRIREQAMRVPQRLAG